MSETVYKIKNNINDEVYIGCSKDPYRRLLKHQSALRGSRHTSSNFQKLYDDNVENIILTLEELKEFDDRGSARAEELRLLKSNDALLNARQHSSGGDNISNHPNRDAIVALRKETYINNTNFIESDRNLLGATNPNYRHGKCVASRTCPKCSGEIHLYSNVCQKCVDKSGKNNSFYGKTHSAETRAKLSKMNTGVPNLRDRKKINVEGQVYESLTSAAKSMNMNASTLSHRAHSLNFPNVFYTDN